MVTIGLPNYRFWQMFYRKQLSGQNFNDYQFSDFHTYL